MNGRGGCCIARHAGGGGGSGGSGMYGMSKVERIMLKYRPIAPKPVAAGSGSGGSATENSDVYVKCGRGKRKYVKVNRKQKKTDDSKKKVASPSCSSPPLVPSTDHQIDDSSGDTTVTLSLLSEIPDPKVDSDLVSSVEGWNCNCENNNNKKSTNTPVWLSFNNLQVEEKVCYSHVGVVEQVLIKPPSPPALSPPLQPQPRPKVVSQVTVECVTDTWIGVEGLGCTDEERLMNMERDTCPGFISDGQDRVVWTNKAYRQMAAGVGHHLIAGEDMSVVLIRKDKWSPAPVTYYPAFTCKVKVSSAVTPSSPTTLTLPCDVWRMNCGGCAWRLDVKAALSLGRCTNGDV